MARVHVTIIGAMMILVAYCVSIANAQWPPEPIPAPDPLTEALIVLSEAPDNLLVGSPGLLTVQEIHLDINTDGVLDAEDLDAWWDCLVADEVNEQFEIESYEYELSRDVNRDGVVNVLDESLLRNGIADRVAQLGGMLVWRGEVVNAGRIPIYFNGIHVVSAFDAHFVMAELQPVDPDGGEEECEREILVQTSWPALPVGGDDRWHQQRLACGEFVEFIGTVDLTPGVYGTTSKQIACSTGEKQFPPGKETTHSTIPVDIGGRIDSIMDLGITWGWTENIVVPRPPGYVLEGDPQKDQTLWERHIKYTADYFLRPETDAGCAGAAVVGYQHLYTLSSDQKKLDKVCGCPQ